MFNKLFAYYGSCFDFPKGCLSGLLDLNFFYAILIVIKHQTFFNTLAL